MKIYFRILILLIVLFNYTERLIAQQPFYSKVYFDNNASVQAYGMARALDSNYFIVGEYENLPFIFKIDHFGNYLSGFSFPEILYGRFTCIVTNNSDSTYLVGGTNENLDVLVMKLNYLGEQLWVKTINLGNDAGALSIENTFDQGCVLTCYLGQTYEYSDNAIIKLDSSGNLDWSYQFASSNEWNNFYSVKQDIDSNFISIGTVLNTITFERKAVLIKLSPFGEIIWSKELSNWYETVGQDVIAISDGYLCFIKGNGNILIKTDFSGNILWSKQCYGFSYNDQTSILPSHKLIQTSDNSFVYLDGNNGSFGTLNKIDSLGNSVWQKSLVLVPSAVVEDIDNGLVVLGNGPIYGVKQSFFPFPQIGIIKTDSLGGNNYCGNQIENIVYSDTSDFLPISFFGSIVGNLTYGLYETDFNNLNVANEQCVDFIGSTNEQESSVNEIEVYPNPSRGVFTLNSNLLTDENLRQVSVINVLGKTIFKSSKSQFAHNTIDLSDQPEGIYFLRLEYSDRNITEKLLISR